MPTLVYPDWSSSPLITFEDTLMHVDGLNSGGMFTVLVIAMIFTMASLYLNQSRGLPPGPVGLPFLGYSLFLEEKTCHRTLQKLQKKYGDLYCFRFCGALYIHLGSIRAIRELHLNKADYFEKCSGFSVLNLVFSDGVGVINGEAWRVLRKFTLQHFRETGMTTINNHVAEQMYDSIGDTIDYLRSKEGGPVEIIQLLTDKCNAIFRGCVFGNSGINEQEVREINQSFGHVMAFMTLTNLLYTGSISRYFILPFKPGYREAVKHLRIMEKILEKVVDDHKGKQRVENPSDFISAYLKERDDRHSIGDPTAEYFTDRALVSTLLQFVGDGVLSVAFFVSLFLKHVLEHEEIQEKIYEEVIAVVGLERHPTMEDKSQMRYTNSLILEQHPSSVRTTEYFAVFPSAQCIRETTVRGYKIPQGAITLMNVWASHHDPDIYVEPEKFDDTRFISEDRNQRPELPIRFGVGRRNCIGESFTMAQVFLFLTAIIQTFKLTAPKASSLVGDHELMKDSQMEMCATPRN